MTYTLWVVLLVGVCDVIDGRHLGFYPKLEIIRKWRGIKMFDVTRVEFDRIKHNAAFCEHFVLLSPDKGR